MNRGRVYSWQSDPSHPAGGRVVRPVVHLPRLDPVGSNGARLCGRYVCVHNGGAINELDPANGQIRPIALGDAQPDENGDFLFEPGRGGGRIDKMAFPGPQRRWRYVQAARFGEVNTYYHLDRMAAYVHELLRGLGIAPLPPVTVVVNAHHAATEHGGVRDGVPHRGRWWPFQGGHYRLPAGRTGLCKHMTICPDGEIHLGPGRRLLAHGALIDAEGGPYRANASHNAGILYHEYGHHITRHTADFRANAFRRPDRQNNRKTDLDEGTCDYWAAVMLGTPHIWVWHRRHDPQAIHPRSLASAKTMADFDPAATADPHQNGTIWGAALWDLRARLASLEPDGGRCADRLVLLALHLLGRRLGDSRPPTIASIRIARSGFDTGLAALLHADEFLCAGRHHDAACAMFERRGIRPAPIRDWESVVIAPDVGTPHAGSLRTP